MCIRDRVSFLSNYCDALLKNSNISQSHNQATSQVNNSQVMQSQLHNTQVLSDLMKRSRGYTSVQGSNATRQLDKMQVNPSNKHTNYIDQIIDSLQTENDQQNDEFSIPEKIYLDINQYNKNTKYKPQLKSLKERNFYNNQSQLKQ
eukprot:TRINITY_DN5526_c0_g1_i2.p2 TRINITY_DN5526_c0_g1~~TRINITY_DN5526_c0_g1_i2.p2  ORF type:complete len:146 (-),score=24.88 TRINITY_DN5526_c0_g1_i2:267-704(-)